MSEAVANPTKTRSKLGATSDECGDQVRFRFGIDFPIGHQPVYQFLAPVHLNVSGSHNPVYFVYSVRFVDGYVP